MLYATGAEKKAVMVERFNRTLKTRMWRVFTEEGNKKWVDILPTLMKEYNETKHSAIKMTPTKASQLNPKPLKQKPELGDPKYELRTWVRISRIKDTFEKGYTQRWSKELYQIVRIVLNKPVMYYLRKVNGDTVKGGFYESELQKTAEPVEHYIESVSKPRNKKGQVVVKKVLSWKLDPKSRAKFNKYLITVELTDGSTEEVPLGRYIGVQDAYAYEDGVFRSTSTNPEHILAPIGDFVKRDPVLRKEVWDKIG